MKDRVHLAAGPSLVVFSVAIVVLGGAIVGATPSGEPPTSSNAPSQDSFVDSLAPINGYDTIVIRITVDHDGTAHWQVAFRYELDDETTEEAFEQTRSNVTNPPGVFIDRMQNAVSKVESRTERSMTVQNGSVETYESVPAGRYGVVEYRFEWTNFAASEGDDRFVVGDALRRYELDENESLWIEWTDHFSQESVSPAPDDTRAQAIRWDGRKQFQSGNPTVVLVATTEGDLTSLPVLTIGGVLGLLLVVVIGWYGRTRLQDQTTESVVDDPGRAGEPPDRSGVETDAAAAEATDGMESTVPPKELLSDSERVLHQLEERGGRMKQQDLIEAVEWSRTKASNVVNEMHEAEQIEVFRLGRENVLALPGEIDV